VRQPSVVSDGVVLRGRGSGSKRAHRAVRLAVASGLLSVLGLALGLPGGSPSASAAPIRVTAANTAESMPRDIPSSESFTNVSKDSKAGSLAGDLQLVSCTSPVFCMAVGWSYETGELAEEWDGTSWSIQEPDAGLPSGAFGGEIDAVSCTSPSFCMAVGAYDEIFDGPSYPLAESWNGNTWTNSPTTGPEGGWLQGLSCSSSSFCEAVGDGLVEGWNGTSWSVQSIPEPESPELIEVSCTSSSACMAAGSYIESPQIGYALAEEWNGTTWSMQDTPNPSEGSDNVTFRGVSCTALNACTALGYFYTSDSDTQGFAEAWNGSTWNIQGTPVPAGAKSSAFASVSCESPDAGTFSTKTSAQSTLAEAWDGSTWSIQSTPDQKHATKSGLSGVSCTSSSLCVAVGAYSKKGSTGDSGDETLAESWNGESWTILSPAFLSMGLTPTSGPPGQKVTVSGGGFTGDASIVVTYATGKRKKPELTVCSSMTDSSGSFTCTGKIPKYKQAGSNGSHTITADEPGLGGPSTSFTLT
jgi:hypothetical protein